MPYYLLLAFGGLWAVLFLRVNRKWLYKVALSSVTVLDTMLSTKSDDEKLEILPKATARLVGSLILSLLLIAVAIGIGYIPFGASEYLFGPSPSRPAWLEITALSLGASVPFFLPFRRGASNYSELSILLHRLVLDHYSIGKKLLKRELKRQKKGGIEVKNDYLIVSGLARSGTTSLMNFIAQRPEFSSLSYANMPFLLSPNLWGKFYKPKSGDEKERSHKDGIKIGLNSYEALEEYYHKTAVDDKYISEKSLNEYALSADEAADYLRYQTVVRQKPTDIYLAKNNNFLLRYKSLRSKNKDFVLVLLFREPLLHAASLQEKHQQYCELQKEDAFVLDYMNWLGHHEFGLGHKPFNFAGQLLPDGDPQKLDYWLRVWIGYYENALAIEDHNTLFVAYEDFCSKPLDCLNRIYKQIQVEPSTKEIASFSNQRKLELEADPRLIEQAQVLYEKLKARS